MIICISVSSVSIRISTTLSIDDPVFIDHIKFAVQGHFEKDYQNIVDVIHKLGTKHLQSISITVPGSLNSDRSKIVIASNLQSWVDRPIKSLLQDEFNCDIYIENSTVSSALAEAYYGSGQNEDFVFIKWGNGLGGSSVRKIDNKINIYSFEPGHMILKINGNLCSCGNKGCLETYVAGKGIKEIYKKNPNELTDYEWNEVIENFVDGIQQILSIRPTKLLIFDGGIAVHHPEKLKEIKVLLDSQLTVIPCPTIKLCQYKEHSSLFGSVASIKYNDRYKLFTFHL
ncbi:MAG: ROK family protein [Candidatus Roizmanbacteria bacterium]